MNSSMSPETDIDEKKQITLKTYGKLFNKGIDFDVKISG